MTKTPLLDRIENFLSAFPFAKRIPVHPTELYQALNLATKQNWNLPIYALGTRSYFDADSPLPPRPQHSNEETDK